MAKQANFALSFGKGGETQSTGVTVTNDGMERT
jgi:hypothetical protein